MVCTSRLLLFHFLAFTAPEDNCHHDDNRMVAGQPLYAIYRFGSVLHRRTVKLSTPRGPCSLPSYSGNASSRLHRNTFILGRYALRRCRIGQRNDCSLCHCGELVGAASSLCPCIISGRLKLSRRQKRPSAQKTFKKQPFRCSLFAFRPVVLVVGWVGRCAFLIRSGEKVCSGRRIRTSDLKVMGLAS